MCESMSVQQQQQQQQESTQQTHRASTEGIDLMPDEEVLVNVHPSWSVWMTHLIAGGLIILFGVASGSAEGVVGGLLIGGGLIGLVYTGRKSSRYVVTSERVKHKIGLLSKSSREYRISDIESLTTEMSLFERLLGHGNIKIRTAANDGVQWEGVPEHEQVARQVREMRREYDKKHEGATH